ncbi:MAG: hypothetical protein EOP45_03840 [Sphingobacteriaceae bacterium]|nr:MAG: hypothetical protein EOP45_03840 [Sphingobacteriaceae bacterium]
MIIRILPVLMFVLLWTAIASAQSGKFIVGIDHFQKTNRFSHYLLSDKSLGVKLGYSQSFDREAWSIDLTGFANYLDYNFDLAPDRYFTGGTLYTGIGIAPRYCFNPEAKFHFSVSAMLKGQYGFGQGNVFKRQPSDLSDESLERNFVKTGFGLGFSPLVSLEYPVSLGTVGLEAGWDSSDAGRGINALRSSYYRPISYHSSALFVGLVFRLGP